MRKKVIGIILALLMIMSFTLPAFATVTQYVTKLDGKCYEYNYTALQDAYQNKVLGMPGTELYNDYQTAGSLFAMYDSVKGYVDFADINSAYTDAMLNGTAFDLNTYVSAKGKPATMPAEVTVVTVSNGTVTKAIKPVGSTGLVKSFTTAASLEPGKKLVMVELTVTNPSEYDVFVKSVQLTYKADAKVFTGDVLEADAVQSNVTVKAKDTTADDFRVLSIE